MLIIGWLNGRDIKKGYRFGLRFRFGVELLIVSLEVIIIKVFF